MSDDLTDDRLTQIYLLKKISHLFTVLRNALHHNPG